MEDEDPKPIQNEKVGYREPANRAERRLAKFKPKRWEPLTIKRVSKKP